MWKNIERSSKRTQGHTWASQLSFSTVLTGNLSTLEDIQHIIWDHDIYHQFWSFLLHSSYWFQFLKEKKKKKMSRSLKLIKWNKILLLRQTATMMGKWGSSLCLPFGCLLLLRPLGSWSLVSGALVNQGLVAALSQILLLLMVECSLPLKHLTHPLSKWGGLLCWKSFPSSRPMQSLRASI